MQPKGTQTCILVTVTECRPQEVSYPKRDYGTSLHTHRWCALKAKHVPCGGSKNGGSGKGITQRHSSTRAVQYKIKTIHSRILKKSDKRTKKWGVVRKYPKKSQVGTHTQGDTVKRAKTPHMGDATKHGRRHHTYETPPHI